MGLLTTAVARLFAPEQKAATAALIPAWQVGTPQAAPPAAGGAYSRYATEGYGTNEIVYSCVQELVTSAAEPDWAVYRRTADGPEKLNAHPLLDLLERPNPFMSRYDLVAGLILYLQVAGNAYIEKVRSGAGRVTELWLLRPDRMRVIPDARTFIGGYEYTIGTQTRILKAADCIHLKLQHPHDDYYGLAPLSVVAGRVDTDNWAKAFTRAFFTNAGVPAGLLTLDRVVTAAERQQLRSQWRDEHSGTGGWFSLLVLAGAGAKYQQMGLGPGAEGLALTGLDEISEARIASVFGVPLELIGARLGKVHGNRTTTEQERASFWYETLMPLYVMLGDALTRGLRDEFTGFDYLAADTSTVKALQENDDAKHTRVRADMLSGLVTREEARTALGYDPDVTEGSWVMSNTVGASPVEAGNPAPAPVPTANGAVAGLGKQMDAWALVEDSEIEALRRRAKALQAEAPLLADLLAAEATNGRH